MKREFLKNLGLSDEQIDQIMSENGNDIEKHKAEAAAAKAAQEQLVAQISERDGQLEELKKIDAAGLQAEIARLQADNAAAAEAHTAELAKLAYGTAAEKYVDSLKPKDTLSRKAILSEFLSKEFKQDGDSFQGASEWAEQFKKDNAAHFDDGTAPAIFSGRSGGGSAGGDDTAAARAVMGLPPESTK